MSDPAIEAAERAWKERYKTDGLSNFLHSIEGGGVGTVFIAAAREALTPIRELHKPRWDNCINACCPGEQCKHRERVCGHDYDPWPCDTARLAYTADELA